MTGLKFILPFLFICSSVIVNAQRLKFIESDFHEHIYYNEESEQSEILSTDSFQTFFGISENNEIFTQRKSNPEETAQFKITDSQYDKHKKETVLFMKDKNNIEFMAVIKEEELNLIIAYINEENKTIIDKYRISKSYYSD